MEAGISVAQNKGHNLAVNNNATSHNLLAKINPRDDNPAAELQDEREWCSLPVRVRYRLFVDLGLVRVV